MFSEWMWQERASAYDVWLIEQQAARNREDRIKLARALFSKLAQAIQHIEPDRITPRTFGELMKIAFTELRIDFDQAPATKVTVNGSLDVTTTPQWAELMTILTGALAPYPAAKAALSDAIRQELDADDRA